MPDLVSALSTCSRGRCSSGAILAAIWSASPGLTIRYGSAIRSSVACDNASGVPARVGDQPALRRHRLHVDLLGERGGAQRRRLDRAEVQRAGERDHQQQQEDPEQQADAAVDLAGSSADPGHRLRARLAGRRRRGRGSRRRGRGRGRRGPGRTGEIGRSGSVDPGDRRAHGGRGWGPARPRNLVADGGAISMSVPGRDPLDPLRIGQLGDVVAQPVVAALQGRRLFDRAAQRRR